MKRWFKYIKPYLPYFIIGPLCMIAEVVGEVVMPKLLANVINGANDGVLTWQSSLGTMGLMILCAVLMMLGGVGGAYFGAKASVNFAADLRRDMYGAIQRFSFANIDRFSTGSLVTRLTNDVTQVQNFVNMILRMALRAPGMLIAALIMAITMQPKLSTVFAVSIPLMLIAVGDKFRAANADLKKSGMSAMRIMIFMSPVITLFMNATVLVVVWLGGGIVLDGGMPVGDLSAFLTYVTQILSSLMMITMLLMFSSRALASGRRIAEVLDEVPDLSDENAREPERHVENGDVEFDHVSFRYYKNSDDLVLNDICLKIPAHATVGIIGSTGCGKTTLVSLISRLYDADEGCVRVDGVDVRDYSLKNLRDGVGVVLQKNTLFSGTIAENLRWGDENASDEEVRDAAKRAQADKFVSSFPHGYDTLLEQGGTNVSGGQKQRLCIARALLKKPKIIVLDDSTSAVDTATEAQIRRAFREELQDSTKIIIAQRISSVMDADLIVVMNDGRITGTGTHDELLKNNTEYQEIYDSQMDRKEAGTDGKIA